MALSIVKKNKNCCPSLQTGMVFNGTFNNMSVISLQSVVLVEETGVPGEDYQPVSGL
jgi:hypothetical protein